MSSSDTLDTTLAASTQITLEPGVQSQSDLVAQKPLALVITISAVSTCQRRVSISIPREDIDRYYAEAIGELMPNAQLPGFRPGRAPRTLVTSRFKSELSDQIRSKLLTDAMTQASEQEKLSPISEPDIDIGAVLLPDEGPMTFEFSIEVRPEFDMPQWKGLSIKRPTRIISESDIEESLSNLLRERGRLVPCDGWPLLGNMIVANLRFLDGNDSNKVLSEVAEMEIVVRPKLSFADATLNGFDALVAKAKAGTTVTTALTVSDEAAVEALRGKELTMELKVLEVKKLELPELSPDLLIELGNFESIESLHDAVRKQLENQLEWHRRRQVRQQVSMALIASAAWDLPPELLRRQSQRELERSILELRRSGFDDDSIRRHVNQLRQTVMASTARSLKEHFILERIAEEESIADTGADYDSEILAIAAQSGESPRRVRASLEKRGLMDVLRNQIIERKTVDLITSHASFIDTPFEFEKPDAEAVDHAVCGAVVGELEIPTALHAEKVEQRSTARR
ncbi:MAG: trigger factor [Planctomycetota bacterium]|nr:MAG: trigger factor [Planctomycetota bacterium]